MDMAIESLIDLKTLSVEELTGRLSACEDHYGLDDTVHSGRQLLFTAEEWFSREHKYSGRSSSVGSGRKSKSPGKSPVKGGGGGGKPASGNSGAGGGKKKGKCHYCGKVGHLKKDYWSWLEKQKEQGKKE